MHTLFFFRCLENSFLLVFFKGTKAPTTHSHSHSQTSMHTFQHRGPSLIATCTNNAHKHINNIHTHTERLLCKHFFFMPVHSCPEKHIRSFYRVLQQLSTVLSSQLQRLLSARWPLCVFCMSFALFSLFFSSLLAVHLSSFYCLWMANRGCCPHS